MNKESIFELQKIDCNCNDCLYMTRNIEAFKQSLNFQESMQLAHFNTEVKKIKNKAKYWRDIKGDLEKWNDLLTSAEKLKYQFDKSAAVINYGNCDLKKIPITFIPNTCQSDTQNCFKHRREIVNKL